jgi:integrase
MKGPPRMSAIVDQYLRFRRGLGYRLRIEGQLLQQFGEFADATGHQGPLTIELALRWAQLPADCDRLYCARRLEIVRCFARYLAVTEPKTQIPPRHLLGPAHRRNTPFIYGDSDVAALMSAAERLASSTGLRPRTYKTLIGLLASTGLRISEALYLSRDDAELKHGVLTIRETKFRKTRLVPIHPTAISALQTYVRHRDCSVPEPQCDRFFVSEQGRPLAYSTVRTVFGTLRATLDTSRNSVRRKPRLHDLRHTFACRRIELWYETGIDVDHAISALSVYLGHAKVSDTYWYLTATPGLMARAAQKFESFASSSPVEDKS